MAKYLDENGLLYYNQKINGKLDKKVDKETGKGLSSNDYTNAEQGKLANIEENAQVNVIESITINGTTATITGKSASVNIEAGKIDEIKVNNVAQSIVNKAVNITVPTKVSDITNDTGFITIDSVPTNNNQLTNGAGYQTASEVSSAISDAISGITSFEYEVVTTLPTTGKKGTIYLVSNSGTGTNIYDEYIWVTNRYEKIGTTAVDLSGYWAKTELTAIPNSDIDTIVA